MPLVEDDRVRVEVVRPGRVTDLARGVNEEVGGPADELLDDDVAESPEGSVFEEVVDLLVAAMAKVRGVAERGEEVTAY